MLQINKLIKCLQISLVLLVLMSSPAAGDIIKVDSTATGMPPDGSSWTNAFPYLQDALAAATSGDDIWVAAGTYKPDQYNATPWGTGLRTEAFQMENGVRIYGGFPDTGDPDMDDRDPSTHEAFLSGDINTVGVSTDNCYHVFYHPDGTNLDTSAVLDGFTITLGRADVSHPHSYGGGMYNDGSDPTVTNCTFTGNAALDRGGGMLNYDSSPTVTNCTFSGNSTNFGGGMGNIGSSPTVTNCMFIDNSSSSGGGMHNSSGSPTVTNCTFSGNSAGEGGGMYSFSLSNPTVTNCTFSGNSASNGGGMHYNQSSSTVNNCIFWGNTATSQGPEIAAVDSSTVTIHHCDVQGGVAGVYDDDISSINWTGVNKDSDPLFVDADGPDNEIGTDDDNLRLLADSDCIDAGDNTVIPPGVTTDLDGNPRISGGLVDMGAYEYGSVYAFVDIGLRLYDGTETVTIACWPEGTLISQLRIAKNGTIYGIFLVDPGHGWASAIRIETASGTKALAKMP